MAGVWRGRMIFTLTFSVTWGQQACWCLAPHVIYCSAEFTALKVPLCTVLRGSNRVLLLFRGFSWLRSMKSLFLAVGTLPAEDLAVTGPGPQGSFQVCAAMWSAAELGDQGIIILSAPRVRFSFGSQVVFLIKPWLRQGVKVVSCIGLGWLDWQTVSSSTYCNASQGSRAGLKTACTWNNFGAARIDQSRKREMSKEEGMGNRLMCLWREEKERVKQAQEQ